MVCSHDILSRRREDVGFVRWNACGEFAAGCRVHVDVHGDVYVVLAFDRSKMLRKVICQLRECRGIAENPTGNDFAEWVRQSLDPDTDGPRSQSICNLTKTTATLVQPSSRNASVG